MQRGASTSKVWLIVLIHNYEQSEVVEESAMPIQELCCLEDPWVDCEHPHLDSSSGCAKNYCKTGTQNQFTQKHCSPQSVYSLSHLVRNSFSSAEFSGAAYGNICFFVLNHWPLSGFSANCGVPVSVLLLAFCSQVWGMMSPVMLVAQMPHLQIPCTRPLQHS